MTGALRRTGNLDTKTNTHVGRMTHEDAGGDWGDASMSQEHQHLSAEAWGEAWSRFSCTALTRN